MSQKKADQLGMPIGTASNRLVKDILFSLIVETGKNCCFHCSMPMTREDFSIEHKTPWLDSEDPKQMFFDLNNISFSHHSCNVSLARKKRSPCGSLAKYRNGCRCDECKSASAGYERSRNQNYKRRGKPWRPNARPEFVAQQA